MPVKWIRSCIECDGCGKDFVVDMDPATKVTEFALANEWALFEYAESAVFGGSVVTEKLLGKNGVKLTTVSGLIGSSSIQAEMMLCPRCTEIAYNIGDEQYIPTADEIAKALNEAGGV